LLKTWVGDYKFGVEFLLRRESGLSP